jgi:hypothetical protein
MNYEFSDQNSDQIPQSVHEEYIEYPETLPIDHYSDDHELNSYPESHTTGIL